MTANPIGKILTGDESRIRSAAEKWANQPVDLDVPHDPASIYRKGRTTLAKPVSVTGPGTFLGKAVRTLRFEPTEKPGWWFDRTDLPGSLPISVTVTNVWTTVRNIVLSSGSPHNYMRMVEHIVALKTGLGIDDVMIRMDSGDPPLFDRSSMDLVEAFEKAGTIEHDEPATTVTVKEPVTVGGTNGSFLSFLPTESVSNTLYLDCAIDFRSAIGKQRIRFTVSPAVFRQGAIARTNTTLWMMLYCKTIGKLFADVRNLGYTTKNIQIAGPRHYFNKPRMVTNGKSLEAAWHRALLDLLAAVSLIDRGRFAGRIISYKSGHTLDVRMIEELYRRDLLEEL